MTSENVPNIDGIEKVLDSAELQMKQIATIAEQKELAKPFLMINRETGALLYAVKVPQGTHVEVGLSSGPLVAGDNDYSITPLGGRYPTTLMSWQTLQVFYRPLTIAELYHLKQLGDEFGLMAQGGQ